MNVVSPLVALACAAALVSAAAPTTRTFYISAIDATGTPVTDLVAADISVKEGGKDYPVASLELAKAPMQVAILVDDGGTGAFQSAVGQFLQKGLDRGQFAISLFMPKASRIVDFTDAFGPLKDGLAKLGPRARQVPDGDQLPDAILDAAKTLQQRKADRPVIVVFTLSGAVPDVVDPVSVVNAVRASGASLNVVIATGGNLGQIMEDGPKQSGGRIETAGTQAAMAPAAIKIADFLLGQYSLTYTLPDGVKKSDRLAVTTSRKGITLTAPTRIADK